MEKVSEKQEMLKMSKQILKEPNRISRNKNQLKLKIQQIILTTDQAHMKIVLIKHLKRLTKMITERQRDGKFEREGKTHGIMRVSKCI